MPEQKIPYERLLAQEKLIVAAMGALWEEIERRGTRKTDLADKLGVSRAYVTQALNGGRNLTLRTVADFAWALDSTVRLSLYSSDFDESRYSIPIDETAAVAQPPAQYAGLVTVTGAPKSAGPGLVRAA